MQNLIDSLNYTIKSCNSLLNKEEALKENADELQKKLKGKKDYLKFIQTSKEKYQLCVTELYEESVASLQNTLNAALQYVFFDKNYKIRLNLKDSRGNKALDLFLIDEDDGLEVDMRDIGQGVRTVISFILKAYYLLNQNSRILLLDEKYSNLSAAYVPTFYTFMESFCSQNNFIIIMISHVDNQIEHADKVYYLNDGVISEGEAIK